MPRLPLTAALPLVLTLTACLDTVDPHSPPPWWWEPDAGMQDDAGTPADAGRPTRPPNFTVMTWNVENLFDEKDDPDTDDTVLTSAQVEDKLTEVAAVVDLEGPDVLALQEIETFDLLRRLNLRLDAKLPQYTLVPSHDPRGINVALMTRLPIVKTVSHATERFYAPDGSGPYSFPRDCLEVHLTLQDERNAVVLVNHQTSRLTYNSDRKRQAQAKRTREIADALRAEDPARSVFIVGDMNDDPLAPSSQLYLAGGTWRDLAAELPSSDSYTYLYSGLKIRLDYVLSDETLLEWKEQVSIRHDDHVRVASDHFPIVVRYALP